MSSVDRLFYSRHPFGLPHCETWAFSFVAIIHQLPPPCPQSFLFTAILSSLNLLRVPFCPNSHFLSLFCPDLSWAIFLQACSQILLESLVLSAYSLCSHPCCLCSDPFLSSRTFHCLPFSLLSWPSVLTWDFSYYILATSSAWATEPFHIYL